MLKRIQKEEKKRIGTKKEERKKSLAKDVFTETMKYTITFIGFGEAIKSSYKLFTQTTQCTNTFNNLK